MSHEFRIILGERNGGPSAIVVREQDNGLAVSFGGATYQEAWGYASRWVELNAASAEDARLAALPPRPTTTIPAVCATCDMFNGRSCTQVPDDTELNQYEAYYRTCDRHEPSSDAQAFTFMLSDELEV